MEIKIQMENKVYKQMTLLMQNISDLTDDNEIASYLTGEWLTDKDDIILHIDGMYFPEQESTGADVDISEKSQTNLVKELGSKKSNNIVAHWHIHPFSDDAPSWSSTDEEMIKEAMEPKETKIKVFLLSSTSKIVGRVLLKLSTTLFGKQFEVYKDIDNIEIQPISNEEDIKIVADLKKTIDEKLKKKTLITYANKHSKDIKIPQSEGDLYEISYESGAMIISLRNDFFDYLEFSDIENIEKELDFVRWSYPLVIELRAKCSYNRYIRLKTKFSNILQLAFLEYIEVFDTTEYAGGTQYGNYYERFKQEANP